MVEPINYPRLRELLDAGAQLVEVLPEPEFTEEHLPGAVNIPLKQLAAETTASPGRRRRTRPTRSSRDYADTEPEPTTKRGAPGHLPAAARRPTTHRRVGRSEKRMRQVLGDLTVGLAVDDPPGDFRVRAG